MPPLMMTNVMPIAMMARNDDDTTILATFCQVRNVS